MKEGSASNQLSREVLLLLGKTESCEGQGGGCPEAPGEIWRPSRQNGRAKGGGGDRNLWSYPICGLSMYVWERRASSSHTR